MLGLVAWPDLVVIVNSFLLKLLLVKHEREVESRPKVVNKFVLVKFLLLK